jgi:hypothetical protein
MAKYKAGGASSLAGFSFLCVVSASLRELVAGRIHRGDAEHAEVAQSKSKRIASFTRPRRSSRTSSALT